MPDPQPTPAPTPINDQPDATNKGRSASTPVEGGDDTAAPDSGSPQG